MRRGGQQRQNSARVTPELAETPGVARFQNHVCERKPPREAAKV